MFHKESGSVTHWLGTLKAGEEGAVQPLWERYYARLVRLARARLGSARRAAVEDEEDAALSAFNSFCAGVAKGQFPHLSDRDDLWRLLAVITARKVGAQLQRQGRRKRGGDRARGSPEPLEHVIGGEPTPEFAATAAEDCRRLLEKLGDEQLRKVALDRMEGYSNDEIAARLGCARRTVARRLDLIRSIWEAEVV